MSAWRWTEYDVLTTTGMKRVRGLRNGPLAIRRVRRRVRGKSRRLWKIDHLPSGTGLNLCVHESEADARRAVELLLRLHQGWEVECVALADGEDAERMRALRRRLLAGLEEAGLAGLPPDRPNRAGAVTWLNGYVAEVAA